MAICRQSAVGGRPNRANHTNHKKAKIEFQLAPSANSYQNQTATILFQGKGGECKC